jgi:hypothetical protein
MIKICIQIEAGSQDRYLYDEKTLVYKETRRMPLPFPYAYGLSLGQALRMEIVVLLPITSRLEPGSIACEPVGCWNKMRRGDRS